MKTLERLVLGPLHSTLTSAMDPLQFAYRPGIRVEDAIFTLLYRSLSHLEKPGSTVRILFFDFSSAFNTIQPRLLRDKLETAGVDYNLSQWILDYLTDRPQFVRTRDFVSEVLTCSVGAPQGTVLAPFLFTLYTADFRHNTDGCVLQKFSNNSAIIGLSSEDDDTEYRVIQDFVDWCQRNHLVINVRKTKEMNHLLINVRKTKEMNHLLINVRKTKEMNHLLINVRKTKEMNHLLINVRKTKEMNHLLINVRKTKEMNHLLINVRKTKEMNHLLINVRKTKEMNHLLINAGKTKEMVVDFHPGKGH
ncbi:unnamed protein product [Knipowitschia caucasica]